MVLSDDDVGIDVTVVGCTLDDEPAADVTKMVVVECADALDSTNVVVIVGIVSSAGVLNPDESFDKRFTSSVKRSSKRPIR